MVRLNAAGWNRCPWDGPLLTLTAGRPVLAVLGWDTIRVEDAIEEAWWNVRTAKMLEAYRDRVAPLLNTLAEQWVQASDRIPPAFFATGPVAGTRSRITARGHR